MKIKRCGNRQLMIVVALLLGVFAVALCTPDVGFAGPQKKLVFGISVGVGSLDPLTLAGSSDNILIANVFSGLRVPGQFVDLRRATGGSGGGPA